MDELGRQRRHNDSLGHHASSTRLGPQPNRSVPGGPNDRYRPAPINTSPHTPRSTGNGGTYSSYYQEPTSGFSSANMPPAAIGGYGSDYNQDNRQHSQSFGGYNTAAMMYNVPQPNTQGPVYDAQQLGSRQPAAMQMMTPDVASTYFGPDAANASASSLHPSAQGSSSSTSVYQQNPLMNYTSNMPSVGSVQPAQGSAEGSINEDAEYSDNALAEKWHDYQRQLATIFQDIASGSLEGASETLLIISSWLLSQVADLGLTTDDASLHADRIKLWDDFNHAWLALGQRQLDLMKSGQQLSRSQRLLSRETIEKLGNEVVRLSDGLERHGLVDYQYGVWEDEIIAVLEDCLDLYEPDGRGAQSR